MRRVLLAIFCVACASAPERPPVARRLSPAEAPPAPRPAGPGIAVTVDDLPWVGDVVPGQTRAEGVERMIAAARARRAPLAGFFTCRRGSGREDARRAWLSADLTLGNHSTSHRSIDELGIEAWREDVARCQRELEAAAGRPVRYFRYPYLRTGAERELREAGFAYLEELGVRRAPVTIDTSEWALVRSYVAARRANDAATADTIATAYVEHIRRAARRYVSLGSGRGAIPHVLLLHANALAADHLGAVLDALGEDGATFVSLDEAMAHPIYDRPDLYVGETGLSWLYRVEPDMDRAWAWDAAQQHALSVRFAATRERPSFDLDVDLHIRAVAPRTWVVTHDSPWPANSLVAEAEDGTVLLVDTPYTPAATRSLLDWIDARFGDRPRVAINTHFHPDALGGNAALLAAGVPVHGTRQTARLAVERARAVRAQLGQWLGDRPRVARTFRDYVPTPPDRAFAAEAGLRLSLGERVEVRFLGPGHSPDNVVVWMPDRGLLFGGCMASGTGRLGNLSDATPGSWMSALDRMIELEPRLVIPGHGDRTDPAILAETRALLADLDP